MVAWLLLGLALLALPAARRLTGDLLHPAGIVVAVWAGTAGLFSLRLVPYPALQGSTVALVAAAVAALVAGILAGAWWVGRRAPSAGADGERPPPSDWWLIGYALLGLAGMGWYVHSALSIVGPDAFSRPAELRYALTTLRIPSRFLFLQYFCVIAPVTLTAIAAAGRRVSAVAWGLVVTAVLATWLTTDRTQFFLVVLTCVFVLTSIRAERLRLRGLVGIGLVAAALLVANFTIVGFWLGKNSHNLGIELDVRRDDAAPAEPRATPAAPVVPAPVILAGFQPPPMPTWLERIAEDLRGRARRSSQLYVYATGSYIALDAWLQTERPLTWGTHTFYPVARLLERAGLIHGGLPPAIPPFLPVLPRRGDTPIPFNAYTFLYYPVHDFGAAGGIVYALIVGVGCGLAYGYARRSRAAPMPAIALAHCLTALMLTTFVNKFNNTAWWYILFWSALPFAVVRARAALRPTARPAAAEAPRSG